MACTSTAHTLPSPEAFGAPTVHPVDEHVDVAHLEALTDIYKSLLERFFGRR